MANLSKFLRILRNVRSIFFKIGQKTASFQTENGKKRNLSSDHFIFIALVKRRPKLDQILKTRLSPNSTVRFLELVKNIKRISLRKVNVGFQKNGKAEKTRAKFLITGQNLSNPLIMAIEFSNMKVKLIFSEVRLKANISSSRKYKMTKIWSKLNLEFSEYNKRNPMIGL